MADTRFNPKSLWCTTALGIAAVAASLWIAPAQAQSNSGVVVNLGVLNDLDPMATVPRLLMPSSRPATGPIVLRPPPGVEAITPQRQRVVLRPPPGAPARVTSAPTIHVPPPAAAAAAPPTSVTSAPASAPVAAAAPEPPPPSPAPVVDVAEAPIEEPEASPPAPAEPAAEDTAADAETTAQDGQEPAQQTAALPADDMASSDDGPLSILFSVEETELPANATSTLDTLVEQMNDNQSLRVQLMAYASSADGSASSVRRKSLSRALSVREYLMDQGIQSTRIEVRALGDQNEGGEPNRVDAVIEQR